MSASSDPNLDETSTPHSSHLPRSCSQSASDLREPGTSGSQATVMDGFPLSKKGMAARALSAAFSASLLGGIFGAFILSISIYYALPIIMAFGFGEQFLLVVLALLMVGALTGDNFIKGLTSCFLGLIIGTIGT